jgi:hypothetical protein
MWAKGQSEMKEVSPMGILIKDLEKNEALDQKAMASLKGGSKSPALCAARLRKDLVRSGVLKKARPLSKSPGDKESHS